MKKLYFFLIAATSLHGLAQTPSSSFSTMSGITPKPELFDDISFGGFDLISANLKYSKDNSLQKVVFSPFKLIPKANYVSDIRINLTQKDEISTFGAAYGFDNTNPYNKWTTRVSDAFAAMPKRVAIREQNDGETDSEYKIYLEGKLRESNNDRVNYFKSLAKNAFSFSVGYNISLFGILGGDEVKDENGLVTNKYSLKGHSISADALYSANQDWMFSAGLAYQHKRKSAVEDQKLVNYYGCNASLSYRAFYLQSDESLLNNADYIKSFFIPSIIVGVSFEYTKADGEEAFFENDIEEQYIITPFLDVKITPSNQFRIGVPIKKYSSVNENQIGLGPFLQYNLTLANKS
ncbi:hypothetical protein [Flavobacterium sp.]|uniref:hypothetical protein n=1 Tax=Flavobacterium sp. TaxID=239 RepID=UPI002622A946|nr:hypothetical protein [Flavobacterium sp.]